jgi:hypothetical protein
MNDSIYVEKIISLLETDARMFSALWSTGLSLDKSVRCVDSVTILIHIDGIILLPIEYEMTHEQRVKVKNLISPIFDRDSAIINQKLMEI